MAFKLVGSLLLTLNKTRNNNNYNILKSQCSYLLKAKFCSKSDESDSKESPTEVKIKSLLESGSPLQSSLLDVEENPWASSSFSDLDVMRQAESQELKTDDHISRTVVMFPGQGNQFVGMGEKLLIYPAVVDMFEVASDILGYDLLKICLNGPEDVLSDTLYCQPATFVCSLALLEKVKAEKPWVLSNCVATCGYSLGELTALVFAGCVSFETGLKMVKFRSKAMSECCKKNPGGMLTVFTGKETNLGKAFSDAIKHCEEKGVKNPVCAVASYLFTNCKVIGGNIEALDFLQDNAKKYFLWRSSKLPVSGAFHTTLMLDAVKGFKKFLQNIEFSKPVVTVFSNVTGKPYRNENHIKKILPKQIMCPVRWEQSMHNLLCTNTDLSPPFLYECGPGASLRAISRQISKKASVFSFRM